MNQLTLITATISKFSAATSKDESVDLVYLDPPFKSNQDYNVLFAEKDGAGAAAQFKAFEDTWEWNQLSAAMYEEIVERVVHGASPLKGATKRVE